MERTRIDRRWKMVVAIALTSSGIAAAALTAQEPTAPRPAIQSPAPQAVASPAVASPAVASPAVGEAAKFQGRLPRYYAKLVTDEQRQAIYNIQAKYHERDRALRAQLEQLRGTRDAEIAGVLTPAQRQSLQQLQAKPAASDAAPAPAALAPATTALQGATLPARAPQP